MTTPEISVVISTDTYDTVRNVLAYYRRQSIADRLEVVLVAPAREGLNLDEGTSDGLHSVQVVECELEWLARARARGIEAARAPVVIFGETHAYPEPEYAEALLEAHRGPWDVVGPAMCNANPESLLAWASLFLDYGPWVESRERGPMDDVPAHNGSYKRDALLAYGERLTEMLESDPLLNADLRDRGHGLFLESRARTRHLNVSRPGFWILERVVAGRAFAAGRAESWTMPRRVVYALGSPLIPFVRLARIVGHIRRAGKARELIPRVLPALLGALLVSAFGEMAGYAFGVGNARNTLWEIEVHRERYARGGPSW